MGLFGRRRRSTTFRHDPCVGDPGAERLLAALRRDDLETVRAEIVGAEVPARLEFLCDVATAAEGRPDVLDAWVAQEPASARARLLRGAHGVGWAWQARGRQTADRVDPEAFDVFFERLRAAEADLMAAADRDPADGVALSFLVTSGRGLEIPKLELHSRHRAAVGRAPRLVRVDLELLQGISAKWSGSDDDALAFARQTVADAPAGVPAHALIASAHTEFWLTDPDHLSRGEVQQEIARAAERSIWHPSWEDLPEHVLPLNHFCMAFHLGGASAAAERTARQIAGRISAAPWRYLGGPPSGLEKIR